MDVGDFLLTDYQQKVAYLTAHSTRTWNRFNLFVTVEAGLAGFFFTSGRVPWSSKSIYLTVVGILLSLVWWVFGAQDRFLLLVYERQVKDAAKRLEHALSPQISTCGFDAERHYVGEIDETAKQVWEELRQQPGAWHLLAGRANRFIMTSLAATFPLFALIIWGLLLLFLL